MKIALAYNVVFIDVEDQIADANIIECADAVHNALASLGHEVKRLEFYGNSLDMIQNTNWKEFDFVFNLVESMDG
ncbi:hypothetical protein KKC59_01625, partial [bacterium]|nr:hypothetical protein [bacterium]